MATIGIIDYGMGNLHSINKALGFVATAENIEISYDPDILRRCDRLLFPGVGAIRHCLEEMHRLELDEMLRDYTRERPVLGICLGMQALFDYHEENGGVDGLGLIPGRVSAFPAPGCARGQTTRLKVPHMGWNEVERCRDHPLWAGLPPKTWFYFVHSYYVTTRQERDTIGITEYGLSFASMVLRDNIFAVQFHLEKSQQAGLTLLANFIQWDGRG